MAKKENRAGSGVIHNAKGDHGAYLGHYRSAKVMKRGHNQGAPPMAWGNMNPNPITNPTPGEPGVSSTPQRSTVMPAPAQRATTERPVAPVRAPRQTTGVPRTSRDTGMAGRPTTNVPAAAASQQPMNPRAAAAQQALESLRQSVGKVRQSRQSARSILGGMNINKGRGQGY